MKIRIKFTKTGVLKFIGHLDMMRYFQKVFRRSGMDIGFTQGFSPHPEISIALPLGIGVTSEAEYLDVTVNSCGSSEAMIALLNKEQVEGVKILSFKRIPEGKKYNAMAIVTAARYRAVLAEEFIGRLPEFSASYLTNRFEEFLAQPQITVWRKTKHSEGESDIRPMIYEARCVDHEGQPALELLLAAGSASSLNPDSFMKAFASYLGVEPGICSWYMHRLEIYTGEREKMLPLSEQGEELTAEYSL